MLVRFLFCLYRFTFCSCAWSSLFGIIMNAQGVATCPPLNGARLLRRFISSVTSWMKSFFHHGGQTDSKSLKIAAYSFVDSASSIGRDLSRLIWVPQIQRHMHVLHGWLARLIMCDQWRFSLTSACHASIVEWDCSDSIQNRLPFEGAPINIANFLERGSRLCTFSIFSFSLMVLWFPHTTECLGFLHFGPIHPSTNHASKSTSFSQSGAPRGYFDLPRSLHGPQSVRFDRGPRRSTLAAIATGSGCFLSLFWNF